MKVNRSQTIMMDPQWLHN